MIINRASPANFPPSSQLEAPRAGERQQFEQVCQTLLSHFPEAAGFSLFSFGTINMNELYAAAQGQRGGPELQSAARWLLQRPDLITELETRGKARPDGKISPKDLVGQLGALHHENGLESLRYDPRLPELQSAVSQLLQHFPELDTAGDGIFNMRDGTLNKRNLDKVMTSAKYSPELRRAAFFLSTNPDLHALVDAAGNGKTNGKLSVTDLQTFSNELRGLQPAMPPWQPAYWGA